MLLPASADIGGNAGIEALIASANDIDTPVVCLLVHGVYFGAMARLRAWCKLRMIVIEVVC